MTERQVEDKRLDTSRTIRAPHGTTLRAKSWLTEAPLRMLMNNLDPDVAEHPHSLVVYGGIGRAARNWECFDAIVNTLRRLENDETMLVQSGKPVVSQRCADEVIDSGQRDSLVFEYGQHGAAFDGLWRQFYR